MSKQEKLKSRFLTIPSDFTFKELKSLLEGLGFRETTKGKTSGSRVAFIKESGMIIRIHKPHPRKEIGKTTLREILSSLRQSGLI